jgi:PTS system mannose-specific IIA component
MFDVIVISHGDLSKAIVETAQMIVGEQEAVETFGLYLGDSVDLFRERVTEAVRERLRHNDVMVVTDMQSGSPFNVAVAAMEEHRFRHFTGMNLPMLLEIFSSRPYCSLEEVSDELVGKTTETILDVNKFLEEMEI